MSLNIDALQELEATENEVALGCGFPSGCCVLTPFTATFTVVTCFGCTFTS